MSKTEFEGEGKNVGAKEEYHEFVVMGMMGCSESQFQKSPSLKACLLSV